MSKIQILVVAATLLFLAQPVYAFPYPGQEVLWEQHERSLVADIVLRVKYDVIIWSQGGSCPYDYEASNGDYGTRAVWSYDGESIIHFNNVEWVLLTSHCGFNEVIVVGIRSDGSDPPPPPMTPGKLPWTLKDEPVFYGGPVLDGLNQ